MQPRCPQGSQHLIRFSVGHFALSQGTRGRYRMRLLRFLLQCSGAFFGYRGLSLLNCCEQGKAHFPEPVPLKTRVRDFASIVKIKEGLQTALQPLTSDRREHKSIVDDRGESPCRNQLTFCKGRLTF